MLMRALADRFRGWLIPGPPFRWNEPIAPASMPRGRRGFCRRSSRPRSRPARSPRSGQSETNYWSLRHEHVSCSRTRASRIPRHYKAYASRRSRRSVEMQQLIRGVPLVFQFRCHPAFLKIFHYGMQHLEFVCSAPWSYRPSLRREIWLKRPQLPPKSASDALVPNPS
jgi:hypothetical protein